MILEGGSVDGNGQGVLLTTDSCLLNANRNPRLDRPAIERRLRDFLSSDHIIWLTGQIPGDDTDGHVDQLARFVNASTVVVADGLDGKLLRENGQRLQSAGCIRHLEVVPLPCPAPKYLGDQRLPASYANFYIVNGGVLVPTFGDPLDGQACEILATCFPDREIVPLPADALALGLGAFHCLTQQEPRD
jgi:agmatine deiminase